MESIAAVVVAYLIGSVPMAFILGKLVKGVDLREYGSGNLGGSNVWETLGKAWVVPVGIFDFVIKGIGLIAIARYVLGLDPMVQALVGLAAVAGHNWSIYLRLTGGRGVATGLGSLVIVSWVQLAILVAFGIVGKVAFKATGLAVAMGVAILPFSSTLMYFLWHTQPDVVLYSWGFAAITFTKRATSNGTPFPPNVPRKQVLWNRLRYDRDVSSTDKAWTHRTPPKPPSK